MSPLVVNGWTLLFHPCLLDQIEALVAQVEKARAKDPAGYRRKRSAVLLAAISRIIFELVPQDPANPAYRQGDTLGKAHRHWLRVSFYQQYRLFFRYRQAERVIAYAWVNDESTLRAYESADDAYRTFARMLARGRPPDDWLALVNEAADGKSGERVSRLTADLATLAKDP